MTPAADQVALHAMTDADLDVLYPRRDHPAHWAVVSARPWRPRSAAAARSGWHELDHDPTSVCWCVHLAGRPVGTGVLWGIDAANRTGHAGVDLADPATRGRGVGTAVLRRLVEHAFTVLDLHRVQVETLAGNGPAIGAARRVGFVAEARLRASAYVLGERVDEVVLGLLRRDWAAASG